MLRLGARAGGATAAPGLAVRPVCFRRGVGRVLPLARHDGAAIRETCNCSSNLGLGCRPAAAGETEGGEDRNNRASRVFGSGWGPQLNVRSFVKCVKYCETRSRQHSSAKNRERIPRIRIGIRPKMPIRKISSLYPYKLQPPDHLWPLSTVTLDIPYSLHSRRRRSCACSGPASQPQSHRISSHVEPCFLCLSLQETRLGV